MNAYHPWAGSASNTGLMAAMAREAEAHLPSLLYRHLQELAQSLQECALAVYDFYLRHNVFLQQMLLLGATVTVFASKVVVIHLKRLSQFALSCLNYVGFISLGSQITHLSKACADFSRALTHGATADILFTFSRVAVAVNNIFLTVILFAGSLLALANCPGFAVVCNYVCHPLSFLGWIVGYLNNSVEYCDSYMVLSELKAIKLAAPLERQRMISSLVKEVLHIITPQCRFTFEHMEATPSEASSATYLAMRTVRQLENSTIRLFEDRLLSLHQQGRTAIDEDQAQIFLQKFKQRIKEKLRYVNASWGVSIFGSLAMCISKLSPDSALDWGVRAFISLLYAIKMLWKKITLYRLSESLTTPSIDRVC